MVEGVLSFDERGRVSAIPGTKIAVLVNAIKVLSAININKRVQIHTKEHGFFIIAYRKDWPDFRNSLVVLEALKRFCPCGERCGSRLWEIVEE